MFWKDQSLVPPSQSILFCLSVVIVRNPTAAASSYNRRRSLGETADFWKSTLGSDSTRVSNSSTSTESTHIGTARRTNRTTALSRACASVNQCYKLKFNLQLCTCTKRFIKLYINSLWHSHFLKNSEKFRKIILNSSTAILQKLHFTDVSSLNTYTRS